MKQSKIKVKRERKEQQLYIEYEHKKKNYLGYVRLLRFSYGKKVKLEFGFITI